MSRDRLAPIAERIAISRWRAAPRTSSRLARLAHAMSSTNVTAAMSVVLTRRSSEPTLRVAKAEQPHTEITIRRRMRLGQTASDRRHVGLGLVDRRAALEHRHHGEASRRSRGLVPAKRHEELRALRELEARRHDANDGPAPLVDDDTPPDDRRVSAKPPLPQPVRKDHDRLQPGRRRIVWRKCPAEHRFDTKRREQIGSHRYAEQAIGVGVGRDREIAVQERAQCPRARWTARGCRRSPGMTAPSRPSLPAAAGGWNAASRRGRCDSPNGNGRSSNALTRLKTATLAPMPTASVTTAASQNPGRLRRPRMACERSWKRDGTVNPDEPKPVPVSRPGRARTHPPKSSVLP